MSEKKIYKIIKPENFSPEDHELATAEVLIKRGDVEFILPSRTKGVKNPDIIYLGRKWEMKCPTGSGRRTIEHILRYASRQSAYIVTDLRRIKIPTNKCLSYLKNEIKHRKNIEHIIVVSKTGVILDFS